jgi:hypothetical protein
MARGRQKVSLRLAKRSSNTAEQGIGYRDGTLCCLNLPQTK